MMSAKTCLKRVVLTTLACVGYLLLLPLWRRLRVARGWESYRVIFYHSVSGLRPHSTDVGPDAFDRHMTWLAQKWCPVAFTDAIEGQWPEKQKGRCVVAHFDDGYADNLTRALPILHRHGIPAACFVTTGFMDSGALMPHDLGCTPEQAGMLTWEQVIELHRAGITIGSHTVTHDRLAQLPRDDMHRQLRDSKEMIEEHLAEPVTLLAYPYGRYGDFDKTVVQTARDAGYLAAATAQYGWNTAHSDRYQLKRIGIDAADTLFTLRAKLNGALDLLVLLEGPFARRIVQQLNRLFG